MFCPGTSVLPDGRFMVSGGQTNILTSIYNPVTDLWTVGKRMNIGRGYQSQVTLSDGSVFTLGGSWNGGLGGKIGEVYTEFPNGTASWRLLPGITTIPSVLTNDTQGIYRSDNHMWFFEHTDGRILQAGPSKQMHWITLEGNGSITPTVYVWLSRVRGLGVSTRFSLTPLLNLFSVSEATTTTP
jgi:galactose oxidase